MEIINKVKYTDDAFGEYWRKILANFKAQKIILCSTRPNEAILGKEWQTVDGFIAEQNTEVICVDTISRYPLPIFYVPKSPTPKEQKAQTL